MKTGCLNFELDVAPSGFNSARPIDFATRLVTAFTRMPPFRPGEWGQPAEPNLMASAEPSLGARRWTLQPHTDCRWSSGRRMSLPEIAGGIAAPGRTAIGSRSSPAAAIVGRVAIDRGAIIVELKRPHGAFPSLLTMDLFAPSPESEAEVSGPFSYVRQHGPGLFGFSRNAVGDHLWPNGPESILFVVTQDAAQGVRLFEQGVVDVTCNPNLPAVSLNAYARSPMLRRRDLLLAGALIFASPELRSSDARDLRRQIARTINRDRAAAVQEGLQPIRCFTELWRPQPARDELEPSVRVARGTRSLVLAYADFEPNGAVAETIANDLRERLGLRIVLRAMTYDEYLACLLRPDADLVYSLLQPPYNDPTGMFSSLAPLLKDNPVAFQAAIETAEAVLNAEERLEACRDAAAILHQEAPLTPVLRVTSKCLVSAHAASLSLGPDGIFRAPLNGGRTCPSH